MESPVQRIKRLLPRVTARASGDTVQVREHGHTAWVSLSVLASLEDDADVVYLVSALLYGPER